MIFVAYSTEDAMPMTFRVLALFATLIGISNLLEMFVLWTRRLPPGPPRVISFIVGMLPARLPPWKAMVALHRRYGPVVSVYRGRKLVVLLGSLKAAAEFLEKKGSINSSRPRNILAGEILSRNLRGVIMPYGKRWRNWRTLMQAGLGINSSNTYKVAQSFESAILLRDLLSEANPIKYKSHLRRFAVSVVFCVSYGKRIESLEDPLVLKNQQMTEFFAKYSTPGYLVESWPILLKLPRCMQWFSRDIYIQREIDKEVCLSAWNGVKVKVEQGTAMPSISKRALEKKDEFGLDDLELAYGVASPFGAGVGSTLASLDFLFVAMLNYPDIMKKVQVEIDNVVGRNQLPEFDDMASLPYLQAVILETLRWKPVFPLGVPHASTADDEYEDGRYVPTGATLIANIDAMSNDEEMFPSPKEFNPERYLNVDKSDPNGPSTTFFFGFGRRICPGRHIALNSLYILVSRILWAFDIVAPKDERDRPIIPDVDDIEGSFALSPKSFAFILEPRKGVSTLLKEEYIRAVHEASRWM